MKKDRKFLLVVYFMVPLFILTMFIPILVNMQEMDLVNQKREDVLLFQRVIQRKMGLMTPVSSGDSVRTDYDAVMEVLNEIPTAYISESTAVTSAATISKLKSFLSGTDRAHVAAHGDYSSGPIVELYDADLTATGVSQWATQGQRCKLLILSACNSMGHDGTQNNNLASAITGKSGVQQVIGYKNTVDAGGAAAFAGFFWHEHLWANGANGGDTSDNAYETAKNSLLEMVENAAIQYMWGAGLSGFIIGVICTILEAIGFPSIFVAVAGLVLTHLFLELSYMNFCNSINSAHNNVVKYGSSVPGLTYSGGGGGGGDVPH